MPQMSCDSKRRENMSRNQTPAEFLSKQTNSYLQFLAQSHCQKAAAAARTEIERRKAR
jgi:hypothetical protein